METAICFGEIFLYGVFVSSPHAKFEQVLGGIFMSRIDFQGRFEFSFRFLEFFASQQDDAEVGPGIDVTGVKPDRFAESRFGFVVSPDFLKDDTVIVAKNGVAGVEFDGAFDLFEGFFGAVRPLAKQAKEMDRSGMGRISCENIAESRFGFAETVASMEIEGFLIIDLFGIRIVAQSGRNAIGLKASTPCRCDPVHCSPPSTTPSKSFSVTVRSECVPLYRNVIRLSISFRN